MRTTYGDKIIENEEGVRIGIINDANHFRPANGVGLTAEGLEFILNEMKGQEVRRMPSVNESEEEGLPSKREVVKRRKDCRTRATRLVELLRVIKANNIHGCDLSKFTDLSKACISKLINGNTALPREASLAKAEDAVDCIVEELEAINSVE